MKLANRNQDFEKCTRKSPKICAPGISIINSALKNKLGKPVSILFQHFREAPCTYRFCPRETSYGLSSGDTPPPLRNVSTFSILAEAPEALSILQA